MTPLSENRHPTGAGQKTYLISLIKKLKYQIDNLMIFF